MFYISAGRHRMYSPMISIYMCTYVMHIVSTVLIVKDLLLKKLKVVPLFIRLMTPNGAIWSLDQSTVIMR